MRVIKISVQPIDVHVEESSPDTVRVYRIAVEDEDSVWEETCLSLEDAHRFLRGVQAGCSLMRTYVSVPGVDIHGGKTERETKLPERN